MGHLVVLGFASEIYGGPLVAPLLHILKTHLRRALVLLFHTSNEPIVFKLTLSVAISLLRRNTPSLVSDYFFVRSECFRILFVYSTDSSQQSSWKLMHSNVCVMKAHRLFSVTDQFVVSLV